MPINIEYLRYARAVAQSGSFSAAARTCRVTQPAMSNGVARLERSLKGQLFNRSPRGVTPTRFGDQMLPLIESALTSIDVLIARARDAAPGAQQTIRAGISPLIDPGLVARAFAASRHLAPERALILREANMRDLCDALTGGDIDLALVPAVSDIPGCHRRVVYSEPVAIVPAARPGTSTPPGPIGLTEAASEPLILVPDTCGLTAFTIGLFRDNGTSLQVYPGEAASYQVIEEWAQLGLGAAMLPISKLTRTAAHARPLHHNGQPVTITYEATWRKDSPLSQHLAALVDHIAASPGNNGPVSTAMVSSFLNGPGARCGTGSC